MSRGKKEEKASTFELCSKSRAADSKLLCLVLVARPPLAPGSLKGLPCRPVLSLLQWA